MKRFKKGQQVVCTHPTGMWLGVFPGPFHGDIVTVDKYSTIHPGNIELVEYPDSRVGYVLPDCFAQMWFEPLSEINEIEAILSNENVCQENT